jgi:hypothetical protein
MSFRNFFVCNVELGNKYNAEMEICITSRIFIITAMLRRSLSPDFKVFQVQLSEFNSFREILISEWGKISILGRIRKINLWHGVNSRNFTGF